MEAGASTQADSSKLSKKREMKGRAKEFLILNKSKHKKPSTVKIAVTKQAYRFKVQEMGTLAEFEAYLQAIVQ